MATVQHPGHIYISKERFLATLWIFAGVDTILTFARLWVRWKKVGRLHWDDFFHCLGLAFLIGSGAVSTVAVPLSYETRLYVKGLKSITAEYILHGARPFLRYQFALNFCYWTCLWCIKFAFLFFYRRFLKNLRFYVICWWIVLAFTFLSYVGTVVSLTLIAGRPKDFFDPFKQTTTRFHRGVLIENVYCTVVDIVCDILIAALPLRLLWNLHINKRQKIGLALIFSLVAVVIAFSATRSVEIFRSYTRADASALGAFNKPDPIWANYWFILEASVAVLVSTLPTFRLLIKTIPDAPHDPPERHRHWRFQRPQKTWSTEKDSWNTTTSTAFNESREMPVGPYPSAEPGNGDLARPAGIKRVDGSASTLPEDLESGNGSAGGTAPATARLLRGLSRLGQRNDRGALDSVYIPNPVITRWEAEADARTAAAGRGTPTGGSVAGQRRGHSPVTDSDSAAESRGWTNFSLRKPGKA